MTIRIVSFDAAVHLNQTVNVLMRMRTIDPLYPPPIDAATNLKSLTQWLIEDGVLGRWVAIHNEQVVGHLSVLSPHNYLYDFFSEHSISSPAENGFCEISKFFIDPSQRKQGIGRLLFKKAQDFAASREVQLALAVIDSSTAARSFYNAVGLNEVGVFTGIHGINHVFIGSS